MPVQGWGCVCPPSTALSPQAQQRSFNFFIACTCTAVTFLQGYRVVYFSPLKAVGTFGGGRQGGNVCFSARPSFHTGKCPNLWGSLTQLEVPGFAAKTGPSPVVGRAPGVPGALHCPGEGKGVQGPALIPLHPTAGLGGGNPPSSSAGKASLTRANENNQK